MTYPAPPSVHDPAEFARQFDAAQAAAEAGAATAATATADAVARVREADVLSPEGSIFVEYVGPDGVQHTGTFGYRLAVTAGDFLRLQVGMQRYTPPGLAAVPGVAEMLAVLHVTIRSVPDWIPKDATGAPNWLAVDNNLAMQIAEVVDQHNVRFRQRVRARCEAATPEHKLG